MKFNNRHKQQPDNGGQHNRLMSKLIIKDE